MAVDSTHPVPPIPTDYVAPPANPVDPCPLRSGVHAWVWPLPKTLWAWEKTCADASAMGVTGLIPQASLEAPKWWAANPRARAIADSHSIQVTLGLGLDGANGFAARLDSIVTSVLRTLDAGLPSMINWEVEWENDRLDRQRATYVVRSILRARPDAWRYVVDAPWWAPLYHLVPAGPGKGFRKAYTHPSAPTKQFGELCKWRFVQAYGANVHGGPDDASQDMLGWSRDDTQYPALGTPAARVLPAVQSYGRSVTDHVNTLLCNPTQCLWVWRSNDPEFRIAMAYVAAIGALGFHGPTASWDFQVSRRIKGPAKVGPLAASAAGVSFPATGIRWSGARPE